jgi:hypothetical protein
MSPRSPFDYPGCEYTNRVCAFDADLKDRATSVSYDLFTLLPINTLRTWQCRLLIAGCVTLKISATLLTLTVIKLKHPSYNPSVHTTNCVLIMCIQYCFSEYYYLHAEALLPLNCWSTSIHNFWVPNNIVIAFLRCCPAIYGMQIISLVLVNIVWFLQQSSTNSIPSISLMYHTQFQISILCVPGCA